MGRGRIAAAVAVCVVSLAACGGHATPDPAGGGLGYSDAAIGFSGILPAAQRRPATNLAGPSVTGGRLALDSLRGHLIVLNFWASWCSVCRGEQAGLNRAAQVTAAAGVRFVGVDFDDTLVNARSYIAQFGVPYPSFFDPSGSDLAMFPSLPPTGIPSTLIINQRFQVVARWVAPVTEPELVAVLDRLTAPRSAT